MNNRPNICSYAWILTFGFKIVALNLKSNIFYFEGAAHNLQNFCTTDWKLYHSTLYAFLLYFYFLSQLSLKKKENTYNSPPVAPQR